MKTWILILLFLAVSVTAFADKPTSYTTINRLGGRLSFNTEIQISETITQYAPLQVQVWCDAHTEDGGKRKVREYENFGDLSDVSLSGKPLYNGIPASIDIKPLLKDLYNNAVSVDLDE